MRVEFPEVMGIAAAAAYLDVSQDTLYHYVNCADLAIPCFKLGNRWKFRKARLDAWMDEQVVAQREDVAVGAEIAIRLPNFMGIAGDQSGEPR